MNGRYEARPPTTALSTRGGDPAPGFAAEPAHVQGDLDRSLIRRVIHAHTAELQACYSSYLERGTLAGRINAQFTIVGDGHIGTAWVTGFDDQLANCVCNVVATMQFLPARGGAITVTYPFSFAPAP